MVGADIAVFEDDPGIRASLSLLLEFMGHRVVAEAASREEAIEVVGSWDNETEPDVLILDGNLGSPAESADAIAIVAAIGERGLHEHLRIIGFAGKPMPATILPFLAADPTKEGGPSELMKIIEEL